MKLTFSLLLAAAVCGLLSMLDPAFAQTWTQTSAPITNWSAVACSADGKKLAAVASNGLIYTSTNSGGTWVATSAPDTNWVSVASSADGNKLVALAGDFTRGGLIYSPTNLGAAWTQASGACPAGSTVASSADGSKLAVWSIPWSLDFEIEAFSPLPFPAFRSGRQ